MAFRTQRNTLLTRPLIYCEKIQLRDSQMETSTANPDSYQAKPSSPECEFQEGKGLYPLCSLMYCKWQERWLAHPQCSCRRTVVSDNCNSCENGMCTASLLLHNQSQLQTSSSQFLQVRWQRMHLRWGPYLRVCHKAAKCQPELWSPERYTGEESASKVTHRIQFLPGCWLEAALSP